MIHTGHINEGYEIKIFHEIGDAGVAIGMRYLAPEIIKKDYGTDTY